jgi:hypothetical protein
MSSRIFLGVLVVLLLSVSQGSATPIDVLNPSFETPFCPGSVDWVTCTPSDWTVYNPPGTVSGSFRPLSYGPGSPWDSIPDGVQVAFSNGGTLTQLLTAAIVPNETYTLSVWVSQRWSAGSFLPEIQLLGGVTPVITMNNANPGGATPTKLADGNYTWEDWSMSWTAPTSGPLIGQTLSIVLGSHAPVGFDATQTDFDNVSLRTNPEPGMFVLVAGGLIGLGIRRRLVK